MLLFKIYQQHKKKTEKREKEKNRYKIRLLVSAAENYTMENWIKSTQKLAQILYSNYWGPNSTTSSLWGQLDIFFFGFQFRV